MKAKIKPEMKRKIFIRMEDIFSPIATWKANVLMVN
jgi:hypothetical protein